MAGNRGGGDGGAVETRAARDGGGRDGGGGDGGSLETRAAETAMVESRAAETVAAETEAVGTVAVEMGAVDTAAVETRAKVETDAAARRRSARARHDTQAQSVCARGEREGSRVHTCEYTLNTNKRDSNDDPEPPTGCQTPAASHERGGPGPRCMMRRRWSVCARHR